MRQTLRPLYLVLFVAACGSPTSTPDEAPEVVGREFQTQEDTSIDVDFDARDPEGLMEQVSVTEPGHGRLIGVGSTWRYIPAPDFSGTDSVIVTARDADHSVSATFTFIVAPANDSPEPRAESVSTREDQPLEVEANKLIANDRDRDGDQLTVIEVGGAQRGTVAMVDGMVTFVPDVDAHGAGSFRYTVSDGVATASAEVTVDIDGVNDAPLANADVLSVDEDTAIALSPTFLLDNDLDVDRQLLTVTSVGDAASGDVTFDGDDILFVPAQDFDGDARFAYTVSDGAASVMGEVVIHVAPTNDAPVLAPTAATTRTGTAVSISIPASDVDGDALTTTIVTRPQHGTATIVNGALVYQPTAGFVGSDTVLLQVTDGVATSTAALVTITVTGGGPR